MGNVSADYASLVRGDSMSVSSSGNVFEDGLGGTFEYKSSLLRRF